jgi:cell wall-associated NlpC family hydrolase
MTLFPLIRDSLFRVKTKELESARHRFKSSGWLVVVVALLLCGAVWALFAGPKLISGGTKTASAEKLPPLPWRGQPGSRPPKAQDATASVGKTATPAATPAPIDPATGLPAASAGSNGAYTPPPPQERQRIAAQTHRAAGQAGTALLLNDTALAPADAPDPIKGAISAANLIVHQPYRLGGGHGSWQSNGYDCSGAVSYALAGGGMLQAPLSSSALMRWGAPGPGQWLTVYANPGHAYAVIAGLRWDTVGNASGDGPRWHPLDAYPSGFVARHFPGM